MSKIIWVKSRILVILKGNHKAHSIKKSAQTNKQYFICVCGLHFCDFAKTKGFQRVASNTSQPFNYFIIKSMMEMSLFPL